MRWSHLLNLITVLLQAREGPILSSLKDHRIVCENIKCKHDAKAIIVEVRNACSESIKKVLKIVQNELGGSDDFVSNVFNL